MQDFAKARGEGASPRGEGRAHTKGTGELSRTGYTLGTRARLGVLFVLRPGPLALGHYPSDHSSAGLWRAAALRGRASENGLRPLARAGVTPHLSDRGLDRPSRQALEQKRKKENGHPKGGMAMGGRHAAATGILTLTWVGIRSSIGQS